MPKNRSWTDSQLIEAAAKSKSYRAVLIKLLLIPAGGNYDQIKRRVKELAIPTGHFTGKGWNVGMKFIPRPPIPVEEWLIKGIDVQSYKLKTKLFAKGMKQNMSELCGCGAGTAGRCRPLPHD